MSEGIVEVGRDYSMTPKNKCPHCGDELHLVIDAFKPEITKVVHSKCPHCGGDIYAAVMLILDKDHRQLLDAINACIQLFKPDNVTTIDNPHETIGSA